MTSSTTSATRDWYNNLPVVTKYFVLFSAILPVAMKLSLLPPALLVWHLPSITKRFEIWRMFTSFFITKTSLNFLFSLFFRFQYCYQLETIHFHQSSADFFFFILICGLLLNAINIYFQMAGMWENLSMAIIYLWAQKNRNSPVSFFFGIRFPAMYLPAVMAAFDFITDGNALGTLCGIVVGHFWFVLSEVYGLRNPRVHRLLEAPKFLKNLIDKPALKKGFTAGVSSSSYSASASQLKSQESVPFSGKGRKLGG